MPNTSFYTFKKKKKVYTVSIFLHPCSRPSLYTVESGSCTLCMGFSMTCTVGTEPPGWASEGKARGREGMLR